MQVDVELTPKTYTKDFVLRVGLLSVTGILVSIKRRGSAHEDGFRLCSPTGQPVEQRYVDPSGVVYKQGDLGRAKIVDKKYVLVDKDEIDKAKQSDLQKNVINLTVHPITEVCDVIWHDDNAYTFIPDQVDEYYGTLFAVLSSKKYAFLGVCNLQGHEGLFRVSVWGGGIRIEKMVYPAEVGVIELPVVKINKILSDLAKDLAETLAKPFEAETYVNATKEKIQALTQAALTGETVPAPKKKVTNKDATVDLIADLKNFLTEQKKVS